MKFSLAAILVTLSSVTAVKNSLHRENDKARNLRNNGKGKSSAGEEVRGRNACDRICVVHIA